MVANTYQIKEDVKATEFMNLFNGKPLNIILRLAATARTYQGLKKALLMAYGRAKEDVRNQFYKATLQDKETVAQFHARLICNLDQWIEKDETQKTVDGLRDLMFCTSWTSLVLQS